MAADLDVTNRSFTTINWGQHSHVGNYTNDDLNDDWQSHLLYYTRYRDLGQGVIEVSLGFYNYGPDNPNYFNMPWGGVRRTSTEYAFISEPGGANWSEPVTNNWGDTKSFNLTGGWIGFSASNTGETPTLGVVFGLESDPYLPHQTSASLFRYGYAGGAFQEGEADWRNYFVMSTVRRYDLSQGRGVWGRFYYVLGDNLSDLASRIAVRDLVDKAIMIPFDYTEIDTPLLGYSFTGSGPDFRITKNDLQPELWLYAYPVSNSFPIYEIIENDNSRYLIWNPYATGVIKTYDGTIAGIRLLGFALRNTDVNSGGTSYDYELLSDVMSGVPDNYIAAGEVLSVRTPPSTPVFTADMNEDGAVDIADLELLASDWLFMTPPVMSWSFDMSIDPVGPGPYEMDVRNNDIPTYGNYIMNDGKLVVTGDTTIENKHQYSEYDMDYHYVVKSTSIARLHLWVTIQTAAPDDDLQCFVGVSSYLDGIGGQTVELWNGGPKVAGATITGLDANAFIDITVSIDYDTQSLSYTVTDGVITESNSLSYVPFNADVGGEFAIQGRLGGFGEIDELSFNIYGPTWYSLYDIQPDGSVDLLDLSILASEWLLE